MPRAPGAVPGPGYLVPHLEVIQGPGQLGQLRLLQLGEQEAVAEVVGLELHCPDDLPQKLHGGVILQLDLQLQHLVLRMEVKGFQAGPARADVHQDALLRVGTAPVRGEVYGGRAVHPQTEVVPGLRDGLHLKVLHPADQTGGFRDGALQHILLHGLIMAPEEHDGAQLPDLEGQRPGHPLQRQIGIPVVIVGDAPVEQYLALGRFHGEGHAVVKGRKLACLEGLLILHLVVIIIGTSKQV